MHLLGFDCARLNAFQDAAAKAGGAVGAEREADTTDLLSKIGTDVPVPVPVFLDDDGNLVTIDQRSPGLEFIPYDGPDPLASGGANERTDFLAAPLLQDSIEESDGAIFAEAMAELSESTSASADESILEVVISAIGLLGDVPALIASRALASTGDLNQAVKSLDPYGDRGLAGVHQQLQAAACALATRGAASASVPFENTLDEGWNALVDLHAGARQKDGEELS